MGNKEPGTETNRGRDGRDYVTAITEYVIDRITYIVIARPSEAARITIQVKIDGLILKEIRKLADKLAEQAAS